MFGLGMPEILLILAIALMVIGPKKLPDLAKTLGRAMGEFKRAAQDFKKSIDMEETVREFEEPSKTLRDTLKEATAPVDQDTAPDDKGESSDDKEEPAGKTKPADVKASDAPTEEKRQDKDGPKP